MCLESGRKSRTTFSGFLQSGRNCKVIYGELVSGRKSITTVEGAELLSGRRSNTTLFSNYIDNVFVNPTPDTIDLTNTVVTSQSDIDGNPSGGTPGGSTAYEDGPDAVNPFLLQWVTNQEGYELPQIAPHVIPSFKINNLEMGDFLQSLEITRTLGGKASYDATFKQTIAEYPDIDELSLRICKYPSDLNNLYFGLGDFANQIIRHRYDTSRRVDISLQVGKPGLTPYQTWNSPPFAPGTSRFDGYTLSWAGEDFACILEQENQSMTDIMPDDTTISMAHETIKAIAATKGLEKVRCDFPNYRIRQLRRQGERPLDWMDRIALVYQAQRYWDGDTLVYKTPPNPGVDGALPKFKLVDCVNISADDVSIEEMDDWKNKFSISRKRDKGTLSGTILCAPSERCPGRTVNITLDPPLYSVVLNVKLYGDCHIENYVYFDENDRPLNAFSPGGPTYSSATKIARIEATCVPHYSGGVNYYIGSGGGGQGGVGGFYNSSNAFAVNMVGYEINVTGSSENIGGFDNDYTFTLSDPGTVELFGEIPEYQNIETELIPTAQVAQAAIAAILKENIRRIYKANVILPVGLINPWINPGDVIEMTDYLTGQTNVKWLVESTKLSWDSGDHWKQELELTRGLNE